MLILQVVELRVPKMRVERLWGVTFYIEAAPRVHVSRKWLLRTSSFMSHQPLRSFISMMARTRPLSRWLLFYL